MSLKPRSATVLYGTLLPYSFHVGIDTTFNMDASSGKWRTILHMVQPHAMRLGDLILCSSTLYLHNCGACISHPKPYWPLLYSRKLSKSNNDITGARALWSTYPNVHSQHNSCMMALSTLSSIVGTLYVLWLGMVERCGVLKIQYVVLVALIKHIETETGKFFNIVTI